MINIKNVSKFCKDPIDLIENYDEAIKSTETWHCHHRLETELNLSREELKERDLYFNRPASELIFLTHSEHMRLHMYGKTGEKSRMYGKQSGFKGKNHREETKKIQSEKRKGENNPMYGKTPWNKGKPGTTRGKHRVYHEDGTWHMEK